MGLFPKGSISSISCGGNSVQHVTGGSIRLHQTHHTHNKVWFIQSEAAGTPEGPRGQRAVSDI